MIYFWLPELFHIKKIHIKLTINIWAVCEFLVTQPLIRKVLSEYYKGIKTQIWTYRV